MNCQMRNLCKHSFSIVIYLSLWLQAAVAQHICTALGHQIRVGKLRCNMLTAIAANRHAMLTFRLHNQAQLDMLRPRHWQHQSSPCMFRLCKRGPLQVLAAGRQHGTAASAPQQGAHYWAVCCMPAPAAMSMMLPTTACFHLHASVSSHLRRRAGTGRQPVGAAADVGPSADSNASPAAPRPPQTDSESTQGGPRSHPVEGQAVWQPAPVPTHCTSRLSSFRLDSHCSTARCLAAGTDLSASDCVMSMPGCRRSVSAWAIPGRPRHANGRHGSVLQAWLHCVPQGLWADIQVHCLQT